MTGHDVTWHSVSEHAPKTSSENYFGDLEIIATIYGAFPTGVAVSRRNRIFLNFPRTETGMPYTIAEYEQGKFVAFPNEDLQRWPGRDLPNSNDYADEKENAAFFVSAQAVVIDALDRLWVLDTGAPKQGKVVPGGAKLVCVDLQSNRVVKNIPLPDHVAGRNSYMNDVRFDLNVAQSTAKVEDDFYGTAYITDSSGLGPNAIIVVDLATGHCFRRLNQHYSVLAEPNFVMFAEGRPLYSASEGQPRNPIVFALDGIALSPDGEEVYYCPIAGTKLYAVKASVLRDPTKSEVQVAATVRIVAGKPTSDGIECDALGRVYLSDAGSNSIQRWDPSSGIIETLAHDPRLIWPDTLSLSEDGYLYITSNQLNRHPSMHDGVDFRVQPFHLFRLKVDSRKIGDSQESTQVK